VSTTTAYTVSGMTCDHCVRAVTGELARIPGVSGVDIELANGRVTLTSDQPVAVETVRAAVDEAGYTLAP
jgi:copper chaperone